MSIERVYPCENYEYEGFCSLGKECHFWNKMQHCPLYKKGRHSKPIRENSKQEKIEKLNEKEGYEEL